MKKYSNLFKSFIQSEQFGGIVLVLCTCISLFIANTTQGYSYIHFWHTAFDLSFWFIDLNLTVEQWINDGLMVVFFVLVGLEIERELYEGELNTFSKAILPVAAAVGGMVVPAVIHLIFNNGLPTQAGFAIPMATDIAFALGILSLAGKHVPFALKIFLAALAIIDDLGAIVIIATCYASNINVGYLVAAIAVFFILLLFNRLKYNKLWYYVLPGLVMWYCMFHSGIHAAVAGVMWAFALPFSKTGNNISNQLQHKLHYPVAWFIVPLFALANTAFTLPQNLLAAFTTPNSLGIMVGLVIGKLVGVFSFAFVLVKLKWGKLYQGMNWNNLFAVSMLTGIGFTMSIFITNLAFYDNEALTTVSKLSVLVASTIAAVTGLVLLKLFSNKPQLTHGKDKS